MGELAMTGHDRKDDGRDDYLWDPSAPPDPDVVRLESLLSPLRYDAPLRGVKRSRLARVPVIGLSVALAAAASVGAIVAASSMTGERAEPDELEIATPACAVADPDEPWSVVADSGAPRCGGGSMARAVRLAVGGWIETDDESRATVRVADIGTVTLAPRSRLRLVESRSDEHRLALERGEIHARINAPPRIFFVDTPSSTAVDLGCEYTLTVNDDGSGMIDVSLGYVSLEHQGRTAFVPEGARCETRAGHGPGTPFRAAAPEPLRQALRELDFEGRTHAVSRVLELATEDDTLTLWHLVARTDGANRQMVYDRLAAISPPPDTVDEAEVLAGSAEALERWRQDLENLW
jgi:hypothetical protein